MRPTIDVGDVVLVERIAPSEARVGDVISFVDPDDPRRIVTHRLRDLTVEGPSVAFVTKGDANTAEERWRVPATGEVGRVLYRVPRVGYLLRWAATRAGRLLLVVLPALAIGALELRRIWRTPPEEVRDVAGSYPVEGVAYAYRSASLTADAVLPEGAYAYTLTLTDAAGNARTQTGFSVVVDDAPPSGVDVQTANGGTTPGRAEAGDTVTLAFSERIDPGSVLAGWGGTATSVQVRIVNAGGSDTLQVRTANGASVLPLGTVALGGNYVTTTRNFNGSTMVQVGAVVRLTLGAPSGGTRTVTSPGRMTWIPSAGAFDAAGNATVTTPVQGSVPPVDVEF